MKKLILLALALPALAFASPSAAAGHWTGGGATYDAAGHEIDQFVISLVNTNPDPGTVESNAVITLAGGKTENYWQKITMRETGFTIETADGKGGGYCFGEGVCQSYVGDARHGVATTIIYDSQSAMRLLSTELDNGRPVHFIRQRLNLSGPGGTGLAP